MSLFWHTWFLILIKTGLLYTAGGTRFHGW